MNFVKVREETNIPLEFDFTEQCIYNNKNKNKKVIMSYEDRNYVIRIK